MQPRSWLGGTMEKRPSLLHFCSDTINVIQCFEHALYVSFLKLDNHTVEKFSTHSLKY